MFNFTTTHVLNSNYDLTTNKVLWHLNVDKDKNPILLIKGVNNFKKPNVVKIYKAEYTEPELAQVEIDLSKVPASVKKDDTLRLSIYIRLAEADQSSYYANDTRYKGRPFTIEFPWLGDAETTLKNVVKLIRKWGLLVFEKEVVTVEEDGTKLVLTAVNEFQRFHVVKLEKYLDPTGLYQKEWEDLSVDGLITVKKEGKEAFGTYGWVLRNIKLPTHEHTTAFAPKQNEMPVPGAHYNQYTIQYCVDRGPLGLNAVGDSVKSVTTAVFYVNTSILTEDMTDKTGTYVDGGEGDIDGAASFEKALEQIGTLESVPA